MRRVEGSAPVLSAVMEDYIKAIYVLAQETDDRVATSALAEYLDVTPPTVSSMLGKLEDRGLAEREEYRGVTLTEEGELVALEILRHHRLIEAFLTEHLDYDWADVHEEADRLEHHISEQFEARIAEVLGDPGLDPHGDPIPDADLRLPESAADRTRLTDAAVGDRVTVQRIRHQDEEALRYLVDAGVQPGTDLEVVDVAPFGMVTVAVDGGEQSLPAEIAGRIEVEPAGEDEAAV
jgi:DtxR family Mn-dependent transcriptional regulator